MEARNRRITTEERERERYHVLSQLVTGSCDIVMELGVKLKVWKIRKRGLRGE